MHYAYYRSELKSFPATNSLHFSFNLPSLLCRLLSALRSAIDLQRSVDNILFSVYVSIVRRGVILVLDGMHATLPEEGRLIIAVQLSLGRSSSNGATWWRAMR